MSGNTFIDTNVLVYAYSNDDLLKKAQALLALQAADAWLSTQVLIEFANVCVRKLKVAWPGVEAALTELAAEFRIHSTTPTTVVKATQLANRYSLSWFDALIVAAALECNCETLYSEDMQHGLLIERSLRVVNPFLR